MRIGDHEAAHTLREIGLSHLKVRVPTSFHRWKQDVRDDYGAVEERTLYRAMAWLIKYGLVRRSDNKVTDDDDDAMSSNCVAYMYYRISWESKVPYLKRSVRCVICGKLGVTKHSHGPGEVHMTKEEWRELDKKKWNARRRELRAMRSAARPDRQAPDIHQLEWVQDLRERLNPFEVKGPKGMRRRSSRAQVHRRVRSPSRVRSRAA